MYLKKIPHLIRRSRPELTWHIPTQQPEIYLTFDDGPTPEITPWVIEQLTAYDALGTFFLVGERVKDHPEIVHQTIDAGHSIANHSHTHLDGWKHTNRKYLRDVLRADQTIREYTGVHPRLFRPPYGHITYTQGQYLLRHYQIIMMDIVSGDFDVSLTGEAVAETVIKHAQPGSIVVFHDSQKAWPRLQTALPRVLAHFHREGYRFRSISTRQYRDTNLRKTL